MDNSTEEISKKEKIIFKKLMSTIGICVFTSQPLYGMDDDSQQEEPHIAILRQQQEIVDDELKKEADAIEQRNKSVLEEQKKRKAEKLNGYISSYTAALNKGGLKKDSNSEDVEVEKSLNLISTFYDENPEFEVISTMTAEINDELGQKYFIKYKEYNVKAKDSTTSTRKQSLSKQAKRYLALSAKFYYAKAAYILGSRYVYDESENAKKEKFEEGLSYMKIAAARGSHKAQAYFERNPEPRFINPLEKRLNRTLQSGQKWLYLSEEFSDFFIFATGRWLQGYQGYVAVFMKGINVFASINKSIISILNYRESGDKYHLLELGASATKLASMKLETYCKEKKDEYEEQYKEGVKKTKNIDGEVEQLKRGILEDDEKIEKIKKDREKISSDIIEVNKIILNFSKEKADYNTWSRASQWWHKDTIAKKRAEFLAVEKKGKELEEKNNSLSSNLQLIYKDREEKAKKENSLNDDRNKHISTISEIRKESNFNATMGAAVEALSTGISQGARETTLYDTLGQPVKNIVQGFFIGFKYSKTYDRLIGQFSVDEYLLNEEREERLRDTIMYANE